MEPSDRARSAHAAAWRLARRAGAIVGGGLLVLAGLFMLLTPGPGVAAILGGLVLLASEVAWARTLLHKLRAWLNTLLRKVRNRM